MDNNYMPGNTVGSLTSTQHAVLVGSLLGDGTLRKQGSRINALLEVNHSYKSKNYVDWKFKIFQSYVLTPPKHRFGNGTRVAYRFTTQSLPVFTSYYDWFYQDRKKIIPLDLILNPLILAVWFMDDGSKSRSACYLNTQQFSLQDQILLSDFLRRDFGIQSALNRDKQYFRLRITTESTRKLYSIIDSYVLNCFRYKLGNDPVTTDSKEDAFLFLQDCNTPTLADPTEAMHN